MSTTCLCCGRPISSIKLRTRTASEKASLSSCCLRHVYKSTAIWTDSGLLFRKSTTPTNPKPNPKANPNPNSNPNPNLNSNVGTVARICTIDFRIY